MKAHWDLKFKAATAEQAQLRLQLFEAVTKLKVEQPRLAQYWKMPECFECHCVTDGFSEHAATALAEARAACKLIGTPWHEDEPTFLADDSLDYSAVLDARMSTVRVEHLRWAHCQLLPRQFGDSGH